MSLLSIRERLENLKRNPKKVTKPLGAKYFTEEEKSVEEPRRVFSIDTVYQRKLEKAMTKIDTLKKKMVAGGSYLNLYPEFKTAEKEFLEILNESEAKNTMFIEPFAKKLEDFKNKIKK